MRDLPTWAADLLRDGRVGYLATASAEGRPLGVVVCYVFDDFVFYSVVDAKPKTTRRLRRLKNIEANPRVSLTVNHYEEDWTALRHVIVEGHAILLQSGAERAAAIEMLREKYTQYARMEVARDFGDVIRIDAGRFICWSGEA